MSGTSQVKQEKGGLEVGFLKLCGLAEANKQFATVHNILQKQKVPKGGGCYLAVIRNERKRFLDFSVASLHSLDGLIITT